MVTMGKEGKEHEKTNSEKGLLCDFRNNCPLRVINPVRTQH